MGAVVVTLGFAGSHLAAHLSRLPKSTIAASVLDPVLQTLPLRAGKSGRHNFTYVTTFHRIDDQEAGRKGHLMTCCHGARSRKYAMISIWSTCVGAQWIWIAGILRRSAVCRFAFQMATPPHWRRLRAFPRGSRNPWCGAAIDCLRLRYRPISSRDSSRDRKSATGRCGGQGSRVDAAGLPTGRGRCGRAERQGPTVSGGGDDSPNGRSNAVHSYGSVTERAEPRDGDAHRTARPHWRHDGAPPLAQALWVCGDAWGFCPDRHGHSKFGRADCPDSSERRRGDGPLACNCRCRGAPTSAPIAGRRARSEGDRPAVLSLHDGRTSGITQDAVACAGSSGRAVEKSARRSGKIRLRARIKVLAAGCALLRPDNRAGHRARISIL
jgi:hypothetical protein